MGRGKGIGQHIVYTALFVAAACGTEPVKSQNSYLVTADVSRGDVTKVIAATGKIVPVETIMVGSEVSGKLLDVFVDFNDQVEAGQILARIDPTSYISRVNQIENAIASALSNIEVQSAQIERANVALRASRQQLERRRVLLLEDATSQSAFETAERDFGLAEADLKLAEAQLAASQAGAKRLRAELADAKANLERTTITSPISGVVLDRKVDPGQTVQASFSAPELFSIAADLAQIQVEASIVEADVSGLEPGDIARFTVDAYPDKKVDGAVEKLRLKSTEANNIVSYTAIISARNNEGVLLPGMTANLQIVTDIKSDVIRIPVTAERFRPAPDDVELFEKKQSGTAVEAPSLLDPTYARLREIGLSQARIEQFKQMIVPATQSMIDIINDPTKSFMHTPTKIALADVTDNVLGQFLTPLEQEAYAAQLTLERSIRPADIWVATAEGEMQRRAVKLGLSDGTYVVVHDGLELGDAVVTGVREAVEATS